MKKILLFTIFACSFFTVNSQFLIRSTIGTFGSSASNDGIQIQQTVGQPSLTTSTKNTEGILLRQGFQQPVLFQKKSNSKTINVVVYPNPNDGNFNLLVDIEKDKKYSVEIYDLNLKLIFKSNFTGGTVEQIKLPFGTPNATYNLKLQTPDNFVGNAKIVVI